MKILIYAGFWQIFNIIKISAIPVWYTTEVILENQPTNQPTQFLSCNVYLSRNYSLFGLDYST